MEFHSHRSLEQIHGIDDGGRPHGRFVSTLALLVFFGVTAWLVLV